MANKHKVDKADINKNKIDKDEVNKDEAESHMIVDLVALKL